jgi:hypothetical protein
MTAEDDLHNTLDGAFRAAFLLTGSLEVAETAVLDGIAASDVSHVLDEVLIFESVKSAIRRRAPSPGQSAQGLSRLPVELRRLFLLAPLSRDCFVLRILLGIPSATCAAVLRLRVHKIEAVLYSALQDLRLLNAYGSIPSEIIHHMQRYYG